MKLKFSCKKVFHIQINITLLFSNNHRYILSTYIMIKKIIFITSLILLLNGCAAVMIYKHFKENSTTTDEDKQKFLANFNDTNSKRQKEGLQPLDICAEKRKFDADWANEDPQCK